MLRGRLKALEKDLTAARRRLKKAGGRLTLKAGSREQQAWRAAEQEVLGLERQLAAEKGEPYAVPSDFAVQWSTGAPLPFVLTSGSRTFLTFLVNQPDPDWDGTSVKSVDAASDESELWALVEAESCTAVKLGPPNDEVLSGHPLHGRGLEPYSAQVVANSPWLAEVKAINKVHPQYSEDRWADVKHFVFWFHDETFECLAESFKVELHQSTMRDLLRKVADRVLE